MEGSGAGAGKHADPDPPKNGYLWSFLDERGTQSAPVCHSGQASHREQRTASGDKLPLVHKTTAKAGDGASVRHSGQASH